MKRHQLQPPPTRAEKRAAEVDRWVKHDVAERRQSEAAKKARLKELRLARDALLRTEESQPVSESGEANEMPLIGGARR